MTPGEVDRILQEWIDSRDETLEPELAAVCTALFLEDTFDVTLNDIQIDPSVLGTLGGMRSVLSGSIGGA